MPAERRKCTAQEAYPVQVCTDTDDHQPLDQAGVRRVQTMPHRVQPLASKRCQVPHEAAQGHGEESVTEMIHVFLAFGEGYWI